MSAPPRHAPIVLDTTAKLHTHDHEIRATCPSCLHHRQLDLAAIVAEDGDMDLDTLRARLRCGKCSERGGMELRTSV